MRQRQRDRSIWVTLPPHLVVLLAATLALGAALTLAARQVAPQNAMAEMHHTNGRHNVDGVLRWSSAGVEMEQVKRASLSTFPASAFRAELHELTHGGCVWEVKEVKREMTASIVPAGGTGLTNH